ncbi:MAG: KOW domain-containing RNA-binding protein [Clostridiales bacterium]|nr:KOW domain-containing RNA-binding protein [Clostridiales bacterium]
MSETRFGLGDIVRSRAGRDKGRTFVIVETLEEPWVRVCDGDLRKLERPKRKKIMHLMACPHLPKMLEVAEGEPVCDADIRKYLKKLEV